MPLPGPFAYLVWAPALGPRHCALKPGLLTSVLGSGGLGSLSQIISRTTLAV